MFSPCWFFSTLVLYLRRKLIFIKKTGNFNDLHVIHTWRYQFDLQLHWTCIDYTVCYTAAPLVLNSANAIHTCESSNCKDSNRYTKSSGTQSSGNFNILYIYQKVPL